MKLHVERADRTGDLIAMTLRYSDGANSWLHSFETAPLSEEEVEQMLSAFGFGNATWLGSKRRGVAACMGYGAP
jgi:hypothetical protein